MAISSNVLRDDVDQDNLIKITKWLRKVKPSMKNHTVTGIFLPKTGDQNVVFQVADVSDLSKNDIVMISAEYILEEFKRN